MSNNRGQSLVLFVLIIPIVLLVIVGIVDIGKISLLKEELDNINYITIDYGLDNLDKNDINEDLETVIKKNKTDIEKINIEIDNKQIKIVLEDNVNLVLLKNSNILSIKSSYIGYLDEDKKIIERNK